MTYIKKVKILNFKRYKETFELDLKQDINILVGNNEVGKSTIIEAVNLALTGFYQGRYIKNDISQYLFNYDSVNEYLTSVCSGNPIPPPAIIIELYFSPDCPKLFGNHNSCTNNDYGISYKICYDETFNDEYKTLISKQDLATLPVEYYHVLWESFHREPITSRSIPLKAAYIDSSFQYQNASDLYITHIIRNKLDDIDKVNIAQSYRKAQQSFMQDSSIISINTKLDEMANLNSEKKISLSVDLSTRRAWEDSLTAYLDKIPFHYIGKGEQCIIKTKLALSKKATEESCILLLEEPENHLSFSKLNELLTYIKAQTLDKQLIISTHSSFVLNKLGLSSLILLANGRKSLLTDLSNDTFEFFEKLSGYDTLRLLLSKKTILVEGDSDELVVQKAYMNTHDGHLPINDGIDVFCVHNLSFLRYLEIAEKLELKVSVVTDNDGNIQNIEEKYKKYIETDYIGKIKICYDRVIDDATTLNCSEACSLPDNFNYNTLEPKMLKCNSLEVLNNIFGTTFSTNDEILKYMHKDKVACSLKIFESEEHINFPQYILDAFV